MADIPDVVRKQFKLTGVQIHRRSGSPDRTAAWHFKADAGDFLLRAKRGFSASNIQKVLNRQILLANAGAPVSVPVFTTKGEPFIEAEGRIWILNPYSGTQRREWSEGALFGAGEALALFHSCGSRVHLQVQPPRGSLSKFLERTEQQLKKGSGRNPQLNRKNRVFSFLEGICAKRRFYEAYDHIPKVLTHGDFCERNILWDEGERATLIDLELLGHEIPSFDLCFFCSEFVTREETVRWRVIFDSLYEGYKASRSLHDIELSNCDLIFMLASIHRFCDDPSDERSLNILEKALAEIV